jgi:hypothetical protein
MEDRIIVEKQAHGWRVTHVLVNGVLYTSWVERRGGVNFGALTLSQLRDLGLHQWYVEGVIYE